MARGKQAAKSARRRLDASHDHIDRLTDQLVEAKTRARQHEAAAVRLPAVEKELARVRQQVEEVTSGRVAQLEAALSEADAERNAALAYVDEVRQNWERVMDAVESRLDGTYVERLQQLLAVVGDVPDGKVPTVRDGVDGVARRDPKAAKAIMRARRLISSKGKTLQIGEERAAAIVEAGGIDLAGDAA